MAETLSDIMGIKDPFAKNVLEASKAKGEVEAAEKQEKAYGQQEMAKAETATTEQFAKEREPTELKQKYEKTIDELGQPFIPTQQTAGDLGNIFAMTNILGFLIGGGAKGSAQAALSAQNGMLEGYQKGQQDVYKKQKDIFDENQKSLSKAVEGLRDELKRAADTASVNKELGLAQARQAIANHQAKQMGEYLDKMGVAATYELSEKAWQINEKLKAEKRAEEDRAERRSHEREIERQGRERLDMERQKLKGFDDVSQYLDSKGIHIADKAQKAAVQSAVSSMGELKDLKDEVAKNPNLVGRQGQIRQFTDKYLKSMQPGGQPFDESSIPPADQEALLFAKKYASMLTRYEQGLAGSGRSGSTVAFQKRYNDLLSQNQFNAASINQLFDDMQLEMARTAGKASTNLTFAIMDEMANDMRGRINPQSITQESKRPSNAPETAKQAADKNWYSLTDPSKPWDKDNNPYINWGQ